MSEPKIVLLVRLLAAIEEGRCDFEQLKTRVSEEHPPSTRSLRRYLATLAEAGFAWYFDRRSGTYSFREGYGMRRLHLSPIELRGLLTVRAFAASLGGDLVASIDEVIRKVADAADRPTASSVARPAVRIHMADLDLDDATAKAFELLQTAQREARTVHFSYVDKRRKRTERKVDPYGFVVSSGRAYLVAYDHARSAQRVFALDAITAPRLGVRRFEPRADFDIEAFAGRSISGIMHAEEPAQVTVRFSGLVAGAARADRIVRDRTIVERADGSIEITYRVDDPDELVRWTLRWGAEAEVLAPAGVRSAAGRLAREIADRYDGATCSDAVKRRRPPKNRRPR